MYQPIPQLGPPQVPSVVLLTGPRGPESTAESSALRVLILQRYTMLPVTTEATT